MSGMHTSAARRMIVSDSTGRRSSFDLAMLDARHVQQIVDKLRFQFGVAMDHFQLLARVGIEGGVVAQHGGGGQHRSQRVTQLVREDRQEMILGPAGGFGDGFGIFGADAGGLQILLGTLAPE